MSVADNIVSVVTDYLTQGFSGAPSLLQTWSTEVHNVVEKCPLQFPLLIRYLEHGRLMGVVEITALGDVRNLTMENIKQLLQMEKNLRQQLSVRFPLCRRHSDAVVNEVRKDQDDTVVKLYADGWVVLQVQIKDCVHTVEEALLENVMAEEVCRCCRVRLWTPCTDPTLPFLQGMRTIIPPREPTSQNIPSVEV